MSKSKFDTFQQKALATAARKPELHGTLDVMNMCALGIAGEGGEFVDSIKKLIYHGHSFTPELKVKMAYELGDLLWYTAVSANALGFSLDQIAEMVLNKLAERYPEGEFSAERSKNRKESKQNPGFYKDDKGKDETDTGGHNEMAIRQHIESLKAKRAQFDREAAEQAAEHALYDLMDAKT